MLNHTYRVIWNEALGGYAAVPETAAGKGKRSLGKRGRTQRALRLAGAAGWVAASLSLASAYAGPLGGQISAGQGSISQSGATTTINQASNKLAIDWQSFNVGASETVNFVQPGISAIALNRVLGVDGSSILGRINANGQVFILNPNGVMFGQGAQARR